MEGGAPAERKGEHLLEHGTQKKKKMCFLLQGVYHDKLVCVRVRYALPVASYHARRRRLQRVFFLKVPRKK